MNLCLHARRAQSAWAYKVRNAWCRATRPWSLDSDVPLEDFLSQPLATPALLHRLTAKRSTFATIEFCTFFGSVAFVGASEFLGKAA
jgi:hypothetical protein